MRGDDERRMDKLKEFASPEDNMLSDMRSLGLMNESGSGSNGKAKKGEGNKKKYMSQQKVMTGVDYRNTSLHYNRGIEIDRQYQRSAAISNYLPCHMQHITNRMGVEQKCFKALKENNFKERGFLDPISTLNTRKDFSSKSAKTQAKTGDGQRKRNLTFNQLLSKFGYIQDDGVSKKERVRPWHIKTAKEQLSDSSSDGED